MDSRITIVCGKKKFHPSCNWIRFFSGHKTALDAFNIDVERATEPEYTCLRH